MCHNSKFPTTVFRDGPESGLLIPCVLTPPQPHGHPPQSCVYGQRSICQVRKKKISQAQALRIQRWGEGGPPGVLPWVYYSSHRGAIYRAWPFQLRRGIPKSIRATQIQGSSSFRNDTVPPGLLEKKEQNWAKFSKIFSFK